MDASNPLRTRLKLDDLEDRRLAAVLALTQVAVPAAVVRTAEAGEAGAIAIAAPAKPPAAATPPPVGTKPMVVPIPGQMALQSATHIRQIGGYKSGYYFINGDRVRLFALDYRGGANTTDAGQAYEWAKKNLANKSAVAATQGFWNIRHSDRRIILGWYNVDRKQGGWVAIQHKDNGSAFYRTNSGQSGTAAFGAWNTPWWRVNGGRVVIQWGADGVGRGITWGLHVRQQ